MVGGADCGWGGGRGEPVVGGAACGRGRLFCSGRGRLWEVQTAGGAGQAAGGAGPAQCGAGTWLLLPVRLPAGQLPPPPRPQLNRY